MAKHKEKALVLCGGGGKGAFQIGVWKSLEENDILKDVTAFSGTSVGALNAILLVLGDYKKAAEIWNRISPKNLLPPTDLLAKILIAINNPQLALKEILQNGIFGRSGLAKIIDSLDLEKVSNSKKKIFVGIGDPRNLRTPLKTNYIQLNGKSPIEIKNYLLASSAIPIIYPKERIGKKVAVDGGFLRNSGNTPILPVYKAGYRDIIIVALEEKFDITKMRDFLVGKVDISQFSDCKFTVIKPQKPLGGVLNFSHKTLVQNMQQGYDDANTALSSLKKLTKKNALPFRSASSSPAVPSPSSTP